MYHSLISLCITAVLGVGSFYVPRTEARRKLLSLPCLLVSRVEGPLPKTTQGKTLRKDAKPQKTPILTYDGIFLHWDKIPKQSREPNSRLHQ